MSHPPELDPAASGDRFLSWPAVRAITGLSRTTIWRLQKAGDFPKAVRISPGRIAWRASEVADWLNPPSPETAAERAGPAEPAPAAGPDTAGGAQRPGRPGYVRPAQLTLGL